MVDKRDRHILSNFGEDPISHGLVNRSDLFRCLIITIIIIIIQKYKISTSIEV